MNHLTPIFGNREFAMLPYAVATVPGLSAKSGNQKVQHSNQFQRWLGRITMFIMVVGLGIQGNELNAQNCNCPSNLVLNPGLRGTSTIGVHLLQGRLLMDRDLSNADIIMHFSMLPMQLPIFGSKSMV